MESSSPTSRRARVWLLKALAGALLIALVGTPGAIVCIQTARLLSPIFVTPGVPRAATTMGVWGIGLLLFCLVSMYAVLLIEQLTMSLTRNRSDVHVPIINVILEFDHDDFRHVYGSYTKLLWGALLGFLLVAGLVVFVRFVDKSMLAARTAAVVFQSTLLDDRLAIRRVIASGDGYIPNPDDPREYRPECQSSPFLYSTGRAIRQLQLEDGTAPDEQFEMDCPFADAKFNLADALSLGLRQSHAQDISGVWVFSDSGNFIVVKPSPTFEWNSLVPALLDQDASTTRERLREWTAFSLPAQANDYQPGAFFFSPIELPGQLLVVHSTHVSAGESRLPLHVFVLMSMNDVVRTLVQTDTSQGRGDIAIVTSDGVMPLNIPEPDDATRKGRTVKLYADPARAGKSGFYVGFSPRHGIAVTSYAPLPNMGTAVFVTRGLSDVLDGPFGPLDWIIAGSTLILVLGGISVSARMSEAYRSEVRALALVRETEQQRQDLLDRAAHDLRTPLSSIKAIISSLRQEDVQWSEERRRDFLAQAEAATDHLTDLMNNIVESARIELQGKGAFRPELAELALMIDESISSLPQPDLSAYRLTVDLPPDLPPVLVDKAALRRVIVNLLVNVMNHTPPGTSVSMSASTAGGVVELIVSDNGPGVPEQSRERIFEKGYQARERSDAGPSGSGLGLYICKQIIHAHGGTIWVQSELGGGARFVIQLPLPPIQDEEAM